MTIETRHYVSLRFQLPLEIKLGMPWALFDKMEGDEVKDLTLDRDASDCPKLSFWCDTHEAAWHWRKEAIKILNGYECRLTGEN